MYIIEIYRFMFTPAGTTHLTYYFIVEGLGTFLGWGGRWLQPYVCRVAASCVESLWMCFRVVCCMLRFWVYLSCGPSLLRTCRRQVLDWGQPAYLPPRSPLQTCCRRVLARGQLAFLLLRCSCPLIWSMLRCCLQCTRGCWCRMRGARGMGSRCTSCSRQGMRCTILGQCL